MITNSNSPFSSLHPTGVLIKVLVLLTGFHLLAFNYFHQELQDIQELAPHTVNYSIDFTYSLKDWASYDKRSQKLIVNQSREAVSKQDRTTFRYAILSISGNDNIQLYCSALDNFEARVAIKNVLGEELMNKVHPFKKGKQVLEFDVQNWPEGKYFVQIQNQEYNNSRQFEVKHSAEAKFASQLYAHYKN